MNNRVVDMNDALLKASQQFGFTFVDADAYFEGNRLCDDVETPYFQYEESSLTSVFHPTDVGQQQLFRALEVGAGCGS